MAWCTIESDPGVFTEMIEEFGVKGVQIEELYSLEQALSGELGPVLGLFFLFKWEKNKGKTVSSTGPGADDASDIVFCRQTIGNACGTIALLHVLLNRPDVDVGPMLSEFRDIARALPPDLAGDMLGSMDTIRVAHNKFARPEPFEIEERTHDDEDDEAYHFIAYVPVGDRLVELDGLKPAPVTLATLSPSDSWLHAVAPEIERRMGEYSATGEIRFNLLAAVKDRSLTAKESALPLLAKAALYAADGTSTGASAPIPLPPRVATLASSVGASTEEVAAAISALQGTAEGTAIASMGADERAAGVIDVEDELARLAGVVVSEREKRARWRIENERRRHNFVPFVMELIKQLADREMIMPLYEAGKKRYAEAKERARREAMAAKAAAKASAGGGGGSAVAGTA